MLALQKRFVESRFGDARVLCVIDVERKSFCKFLLKVPLGSYAVNPVSATEIATVE